MGGGSWTPPKEGMLLLLSRITLPGYLLLLILVSTVSCTCLTVPNFISVLDSSARAEEMMVLQVLLRIFLVLAALNFIIVYECLNTNKGSFHGSLGIKY